MEIQGVHPDFTISEIPSVPISCLSPRTISAEVICRSFTKGCVYFLLGQESTRYSLSRDGKEGNGTWSGFGGGSEVNETAEETAAREFTEESMNIIMSEDVCLKRLQDQEYIKKVTVEYKNQRDELVQRVYFIMNIAWDPDLPSKFQKERTFYHEMQKDPTIKKKEKEEKRGIKKGMGRWIVDSHFLEKQTIKWWSLQRLQYVCENGKFKKNRFRKSFVAVLPFLI